MKKMGEDIMKKEKILNMISGILYYILGSIFFSCLYIFEVLVGNISNFSTTLFYIIYLIVPIILLIMPIIIKYIFRKRFYKSILYSCIGIIIYLILIIGLTFSINRYFDTFSKKKWCNANWHSFRYLMIDDMREKYNLIGMKKNEVYNILGKEDKELEKLQGEYVICYSIRNGFFEGEYFQISLNDDDVVTKINIAHWD